MSNFKDLVVVISGASSGIGLSTGNAFAAEGAKVYNLDLVNSPEAHLFEYVATDITDAGSIEAAMARIEKESGRIDILVNNAGISFVGTVEETKDEDWKRVFDVNVFGIARLSAAALPLLRHSPVANIVNLCSVGALNGLPQRVLYNSTKGAILSMTFAMATDHIREGIRVNCVSPGTVHTSFVDKMVLKFPDPEKERAALNARQATGRMVTPDEVAGAILYLADPRSASTTGITLEVDGGMHNLRMRSVE
jgi:NAD(P)-dependent dehydrogenase (short-subunit alcohol dehydrogenase family)